MAAGIDRWKEFTEQEQALVCLGLTMVVLDMASGAVSGKKAAADVFDRDGLVIYKMVSEINEGMGNGPINDSILSKLELLAQRQAGADGRN